MPQSTPDVDEEESLDGPPVLGSWPNVYLFVLVLHVSLLVLFYWFSQVYAR